MAMNVAFLNINKKINSQTENLIETIKALGIDIMLLQETSNIETKTKVKLENFIPSTCYINSNQFDKRQQGVTIIVNQSFKGSIKDYNVHQDKNGTLQVLTVELEDTNYNIMNIYAPGDEATREQMFRHLLSMECKDKLIVGGDLNFVEDEHMDLMRVGHRQAPYQNIGSSNFELFKEIHMLSDAWRTRNPTKKEYSRIDYRGTHSRLDRIYMPIDIILNIEYITYKPIFYSDHSLVIARINSNNMPKIGKGTWKLNNSLLSNQQNITQLKHFWENWNNHKQHMNISDWWDEGKRNSKIIMNKAGLREADRIRTLKEDLENTMTHLINDPTQVNHFNRIQDIKKQLQAITNTKTEGLKIRARLEYVEQGENNTKYFYKRIKSNTTKKQSATSKTVIMSN